ncbi:hypothetical protein M0811_05654 [Anaeramoeba ignava]|uniref:Uncharacterized protein n=1 Tax=Anaeramoeba ignava TaxID=1746090 RepID=A0A9Q0LUJ9_ANAIG|nr:hypothetical protein M0811_05654 [Anaeramoeba ignava]
MLNNFRVQSQQTNPISIPSTNSQKEKFQTNNIVYQSPTSQFLNPIEKLLHQKNQRQSRFANLMKILHQKQKKTPKSKLTKKRKTSDFFDQNQNEDQNENQNKNQNNQNENENENTN